MTGILAPVTSAFGMPLPSKNRLKGSSANTNSSSIPPSPTTSTFSSPPLSSPKIPSRLITSFTPAPVQVPSTPPLSAVSIDSVLSQAKATSLTSSPTSLDMASPETSRPASAVLSIDTRPSAAILSSAFSSPRSASPSRTIRETMRDSAVELRNSARSSMDGTTTTTNGAVVPSSRTSLDSGRTSMSSDWPVHPGEINT
ncbi:aspartyl-tRNA synthetase, partial [Fusarium phyllophilum]